MARTFQEALPAREAQAEWDRGLVFGEARRECEWCSRDIRFMLCQGRTRVFVMLTHSPANGINMRYKAGQVDGQYSEKGVDRSVAFVMERVLAGLLRECGCTEDGDRREPPW